MSTKVSRKYEFNKETDQGFHLYEECLGDGNVYLELTGFQFEASMGNLSGDGIQRLTVKLPLAWAEKLGLISAAEAGSVAGSDGDDPPMEALDGL